ncbi:DHS-like NAD/FAD-binding domain-containing protein [Lophiostoma macrostomum CBS 122681]|uniref:DHS-like NAD/FAD-binding domain-containing protein n=1 Tax=Lophiostoma macrostomum CBS 122681 TaxID=1314788 RepID=A0A6A6TJ62_9PLEO|nr:DHS-like NAD/FAD-binding domain-containing protein [Lophiostoma macrostomum CBS 122681]
MAMRPLLRIPYTDPLPHPRIIPAAANSAAGAVVALTEFLAPSLRASSSASASSGNGKTVLLTGAGISVASGLADYRGSAGTYTLNKTYRPIYYNEFCENHEARKRYWARSFIGWTNLDRAKPNAGHKAVARLGELGVAAGCITQNVDSFHPTTHPSLPTIELHGYLRSLICLTCSSEYSRRSFQTQLSSLNPAWSTFLTHILTTGALTTENPLERRAKGLKTNPDGDVDIPDAPYTTFRYPACPVCLADPPTRENGAGRLRVEVDSDGAWRESSEGGVLKPAVIMFGESIPKSTKVRAEEAIDGAGRILVVGSSLATYSAWRLVKRARERGMPIGILNLGGVRGEDTFYADVPEGDRGARAVRVSENVESVLPEVVKELERMAR